MKRRERENPCETCGHYHNYEAGELCGVCGHLKVSQADAPAPDHGSFFPTEILKDFLYIGTYDHASRIESLKLQGIYRLLNCEKDKARVLVYCMSGRSRSPAIVMAFLMKCKGWRLAQSLQLVKECRPQVDLTEAVYQQLLEFEQRTFGSKELAPVRAFPSAASFPSFGFGFPKTTDAAPMFSNQSTRTSIFQSLGPDAVPSNFVFGARRTGDQAME